MNAGRRLASLVAWHSVLLLFTSPISVTAIHAASLFPNPVYETGRGPSAVVLGDFNSDGITDLAAANYYTYDLSILLGQGGGSFAPEFRVATGFGPTVLAVGNFNRDGFQDLAVANGDSNDVTVFLGAGGGAFLPWIRLEAGVGPTAIVVSDFNGDRIEDLVVATFGGCCTNGDISIFLGDGNGGFVAQPPVVAGERPRSVAVADFNRDGLQDLAVANQFSSDVSILLGRGDGTFAPQARFASAFNPVSVAAGDLNEDGVPDLAVVAQLSTGVVVILLGRGDGSFVETSPLSVGLSASFVAVGEFNGDGVQDLAVASFEVPYVNPTLPPVVSTWLGRGDGTFRKSVDLAVGRGPAWVALGDLDGDAMQDLVVANQNSSTVSVLRGLGNGDFGPQTHFPAGSGPGSVTVGDFNEDGVRDLAVVNFVGSHASVLLGRVGGGFDPPRSLGTDSYRGLMAVGDFNGDAHQDLAITTDFRDDVSVLIGRGDGTFGPPTRYPAGGSPSSVAVGDFDDDGRQDLVVTNQFSDDLSVLLGRGDGTFQPQNRIGTGAGPGSVVVGDFDSDENQDLAVADRFSDDVAIFLGRGDGTFGAPALFQTGDYPISLAVADFNQDGRLDLATADNRADSVSVLMGEGDGAFAAPIEFPVGKEPFAVRTGDFDANGVPDLAVANTSSNDVSVLLGLGTGSFRRQSRFGVGDQPDSLAVSDFNSDGREDLVVATVGSDQVWLLLNQGVTNQPPEAIIETAPRVECTSPAGALVTLDGSASTDPDSSPGTNDDIVLYEWFENFGTDGQVPLGTGVILSVILPLGTHSITLRVTDKAGATDTDGLNLAVVDTTPPTIVVGIDPPTLWPPNHRLVEVTAAVVATDACGPTRIGLQAVLSDEPDDAPGAGDGATTGDIQGAVPLAPDFQFLLRAERNAIGPGRTYTVTYRAFDGSGNSADASTSVFVPHDINGQTEPLSITVYQNDAGTIVAWPAVAGAQSYDVIRGDVRSLRNTGGLYSLGMPTCIAAAIRGTSTAVHPDPSLPPEGDAHFYLVEYDDGAPSGFGTESAARESVSLQGGGCP